MMLVTLQQASDDLRRDTTDDDADLTFKIQWASAAVMTYLKSRRMLYEPELDSFGEDVIDSYGDYVAALDQDGNKIVRYNVRAAVCLLVRSFYNGDSSGFLQGYLPPPITALLYGLRDPAMA